MRNTQPSSLILMAGACVSLVMHGAAGVGLSRWEGAVGEQAVARRLPEMPPDMPLENERKIPKTRELRLGVENGAAATMTWLGFQEQTEHQAREGLTEQSAMSVDSGNGGSA